MSYRVTFEPLNRIPGVKPRTFERETAALAWVEVQGLMASDEKVKIVNPHGREIGWQELKRLATEEAN